MEGWDSGGRIISFLIFAGNAEGSGGRLEIKKAFSIASMTFM